jgi:periplasmic protein TonB
MHARTVQLAALAVSLLAHAALLAGISDVGLHSGSSTQPRSLVVTLNIDQGASPTALPPASIPEQPPAPEQEAVSEPEPLPAAEPPAVMQPVAESRTGLQDPVPVDAEPGIAAPPTPPVLQATAHEPAEQVRAEEEGEQPRGNERARPPVDAAAAARAASAPSGLSPAGERERYLSELLAHIEANKHYPISARRRRLEGDVGVHFTLLDDGSIREVEVGSGPAVLRAAARRTLERAVPLPRPPQSVESPLPVRYAMRFRLN